VSLVAARYFYNGAVELETVKRLLSSWYRRLHIYLLILTECLRYNKLAHDTMEKTTKPHRRT